MYVNDYIYKFVKNGIAIQITIDDVTQAVIDAFDKEKKYYRTVGVDLIDALQKMDAELFQ